MTIAPAQARRQERAQFVAAVQDLCDHDRGARSALRSGAGKAIEDSPALHRYLAWSIPPWLWERDAERAWYAVATLIALAARGPGGTDDDQEPATGQEAANATGPGDHAAPPHLPVPPAAQPPGSGPAVTGEQGPQIQPNLGASLASAVNEQRLNMQNAEAILQRLTRQRLELITPQLPGVVRRLVQASVPLDWECLLGDLSRWDNDRRAVAARWLQSFYRTMQSGPDLTPHPPLTDDESETP